MSDPAEVPVEVRPRPRPPTSTAYIAPELTKRAAGASTDTAVLRGTPTALRRGAGDPAVSHPALLVWSFLCVSRKSFTAPALGSWAGRIRREQRHPETQAREHTVIQWAAPACYRHAGCHSGSQTVGRHLFFQAMLGQTCHR